MRRAVVLGFMTTACGGASFSPTTVEDSGVLVDVVDGGVVLVDAAPDVVEAGAVCSDIVVAYDGGTYAYLPLDAGPGQAGLRIHVAHDAALTGFDVETLGVGGSVYLLAATASGCGVPLYRVDIPGDTASWTATVYWPMAAGVAYDLVVSPLAAAKFLFTSAPIRKENLAVDGIVGSDCAVLSGPQNWPAFVRLEACE